MNPRLDLLQPYPFERLRQLFAGVTPNPAYGAISLGIGEPRHATPPFIQQALCDAITHTDGLAGYPATAGTPALRQACADWAAKLPPHGNFKKQPADANKPGLYQDALRLVKTALESANWSAAERLALAEMLPTALAPVIERWDAKEQRRKLQLAQLKGSA